MKQTINNREYHIPTRDEVEGLKIGDLVLNDFGRLQPVVEIYARGTDVNGKAYVCFYTKFGERSNISGSMTEGELIRTLPLISAHSSAALMEIEAKMRNDNCIHSDFDHATYSREIVEEMKRL